MNFSDSIRSGTGSTDTWKRMLTQIPTVSERMANAIVEKYPTPISLYSKIRSMPNCHEMLVGIAVPSEKPGGKGTHIGQIVAKRVVEVLLNVSPDKKVLD